MDKSEKIKKIADHYGYDAQSRQCIEEMAELTQAINKFWRACGNGQKTDKEKADCYDNLVEEMADVWIMLCQLDYLLDSEIEVSKMITKKLDRQLDRIKHECAQKKYILDVCCGSKMFWFDKNNKKVVFMDNRVIHDTLCDGRKLDIEPDVVGDFRNIPFEDNTFHMVVFDPPHLLKVGENSWLAKKYGRLNDSWPTDIKQGFSECMRVLKPNGTLIFKWNEQQIKLKEILKIIDYEPLFGNKRADTHWLVFAKESEVV